MSTCRESLVMIIIDSTDRKKISIGIEFLFLSLSFSFFIYYIFL